MTCPRQHKLVGNCHGIRTQESLAFSASSPLFQGRPFGMEELATGQFLGRQREGA